MEKEKSYKFNPLEGAGPATLVTEAVMYAGTKVNTSIAMEPGEAYGGDVDYYVVEAAGFDMLEERMVFSSFDQLEEFHKQVGAYIDRIKSRGQKPES